MVRIGMTFRIVVVLVCYLTATSGRSVTVDVKAPWAQHQLSFLPELSEYVFDESPQSFWKYVDSLCEHQNEVDGILSQLTANGTSHSADHLSEQIADLQSAATTIASGLTPAPMHTLMNTMIGLGHYLPSLRFYATLGERFAGQAHEQCGAGAFAVLCPGETIVCTGNQDLSTLLSPATTDAKFVDENIGGPGSAEWDHVYPVLERASASAAAVATKKAVLYGLVGSSSFCSLHKSLASAVESGQLSHYSARHSLPALASQQSAAAASEGTQLQGYGVFLDIKNMEYKNVDDSATSNSAKASTQSEADKSAADWDALGLNFAKVFEHVPQSAHQERSQEELVAMMREQLMQAHAESSGSEGAGTMKVWKMHDLGLQTLQLVRTAATHGTNQAAVKKLQDIVHNFPRYASMISATKVSAALREEVSAWYQTIGSNMMMPPNSVFINGRRTDLSASTFNLFDLLVDIRGELAVTNKLSALALPKEVKAQVSRIAGNVGSGGQQSKQKQVRIDVSKGGKHVVNFLNNLEKDPTYAHLPRSLRSLLQPSWSLTALSRNLYTLIVIVDPLSQEGAGLLMQVYMMMQQQYPIRFGVVFSCKPSDAAPGSTGEGSAQEDFCRLFAQMKSKYSTEHATSFALSVAQSLLEGAVEEADREYLTGIYVGTVEAVTEADGGSWLTSSTSAAATAKAAAAQEVAKLFPGSDVPRQQLPHWDFVSNSSAYLTARNLPVNSYSINGIVSGGSDGASMAGLMQMLSREQHYVTSLYRKKVITDKTKSLFSAILSSANAYNRFHPMLEETSPEYTALSPELLSAMDFAIPSAKGDRTGDSLASTTVVVVPASKQGFASAANALQWAIALTAPVKEPAAAGEEGGADEAPSVKVDQRVAIVLQAQPVTAVSAEPTCAAATSADGESTGVCKAAPTSAQVEALGGMLGQLHAALSRNVTAADDEGNITDSAMHCGSLCSAFMQKAYAYLGEHFVAGASIADTRKALLTHLHDHRSDLRAADKVNKNELDRITRGLTALGSATAKQGKSAVKKFRHLAKLTKAALASGPADEDAQDSTSTASAAVPQQTVTVLYNGRKLLVPLTAAEGAADGATTALVDEDLVLLSSLEAGRIADELIPLVRTLAARAKANAEPATPAALRSYHHHSDLLQQLSEYCGSYNSAGKKGKHRFDVSGAMQQIEALLASSDGAAGASAMVYNVEPPISSFATATDDLQIVVFVDPLTHAGQRAAALIPLLSEQLQYALTVVLAPRLEMTEFPLQNFYRYVTSVSGVAGAGSGASEDGAAEGTVAVSGAAARFTSLPRQHVLTVRMDIPEPWNVQSSVAHQDIDNLRCSAAQCGDPSSSKELTSITYSLKNLLVAGQCFETAPNGQPRYNMPPNGLQLTLAEAGVDHTCADTLVMQNLGYFQLQANPGLFQLSTAAGRATELYALHARQAGVDSASGSKYIAVRTFEDVIHRLLVHKRAGMEHLSLLGGDDKDSDGDEMAAGGAAKTANRRQRQFSNANKKGKASTKQAGAPIKKKGDAPAEAKAEDGLWSTLSSKLFGASGKDKEAQPAGDAAVTDTAPVDEEEAAVAVQGSTELQTQDEEEDDRIHVFSLATGHMYERLLRIMMLSVSRHSSRKVKFWLFENYLSPSFKQSAAVMAQQFGFEVGYVTYKWPQWLTQQTQQQRIIWGYKILFLDVLFPLNVKKVIYVDADQVVRADIAELWDLDLQGHAYAYTPFCTSRQETLGFQFWQQGYWKDHLRGRPYHISALYVVDLQRFRRNAVGDTLRATYDQLSRDPNSLANLDQDLPNYAQHQVPIFSLPQEWLWCESWCSDDSKSAAKTIDLCNNPLHKEPKLEMARRVVSGELFNQSWVQLDEEIRQLQISQGLLGQE